MPLDLNSKIADFLRFRGMSPSTPIADERAFYGEFAQYVFRSASGFMGPPAPPMEALIAGFLQAKGIASNTPVAPGGERAFYGEFIEWVYAAGGSAPVPPVQPGMPTTKPGSLTGGRGQLSTRDAGNWGSGGGGGSGGLAPLKF